MILTSTPNPRGGFGLANSAAAPQLLMERINLLAAKRATREHERLN
jgi:hypothetical protein